MPKSTLRGGPAQYKAGFWGRKIKSGGFGRGLGTGRGEGPIGREKNRRIRRLLSRRKSFVKKV